MATHDAPAPTTHQGTTEPAGHSRMPQLDLSTYVPQLFWLFVTFVVFYVLMKRLAVPQVGRAIEARRQRLDGDLGRAGELRSQAEACSPAMKRRLPRRAPKRRQPFGDLERMAAEAAERQRQLSATLAQRSRRRSAASPRARTRRSLKSAALPSMSGGRRRETDRVRPRRRRMEAAVDGALAERAF